MIPAADILAWRAEHPWVSDAQVEQDLIICRAIIELFSHAILRKQTGVSWRHGVAQAVSEARDTLFRRH
jgi:hypothetical protein